MTHGASGVEAALSRRARVSRPRLGASGRASLDEGLLEELLRLLAARLCRERRRLVAAVVDRLEVGAVLLEQLEENVVAVLLG